MPDPASATSRRSERPPRPRRPRWGVRTVWLVLFAVACMWLSDLLDGAGAGGWVAVASLGAWVGLVSAAYCTYRGLRAFDWLQR